MHTQSFLIGSYASPEEKGLFCCAFSPETGFSMKKEYDGLLNPSFLLEHPDHPVLYTVEETDDGAVCAWQEKEDRLILLNKVSTGGASPCHLSLSEDGRWLYCANYMGGSVACIRLDGQGIPVERTDLVQHTGKGPNVHRQEKAHAHCVYPDHGRIGVCDLGEDRVYLYENDNGRLREKACLTATPGSGPRHLAAHPLYSGCVYCVSELSGDVFMWKETAAGYFELRCGIGTLPPGYAGENTAAAIRFTEDGKWLLVSHRGADVIAVMRMRLDGMPEKPVWSPCVRGPRDFQVWGEYVLVAGQRDSEVRAYRLRDGQLEDTGFRTDVREAVCIQKALR